MTTTFSLTTGTDTVSGGSAADTVSGKSTEWQVADTINGGGGLDQLRITAASAATAIVTDTLFQKVSNLEDLVLLGSFAQSVTLGALSDAAGIVEIDGSGLTGALTVDASARFGGITIDSAKGVNLLTGSADDDTFRFTSAGLAGTDTVNGGGMGDSDRIQITDKAAIVDAAFKAVTHVERLVLGSGALDYTGQKVTLGAFSVSAGILAVDVQNAQGATLDATARATGITFKGAGGNDVFKASQGDDAFLGNAGDDSYQINGAQLTATDILDGGSGRDEIRIMDSGAPIVDAALSGIHGFETLVFNATAAQTVTLGGSADDSGLNTIDAAKLTQNLTLTVSNAFDDALEVKLGSGIDTVLLGNGGSHTVTMKSSTLTVKDTIIGNAGDTDTLKFTDAVKLSDKYFVNATGVDHIGALMLDNSGKGQSLVAGDAFKAFVAATGLKFVGADGAAKDTSVTFDFSQYTGSQLFVVGSGGSDTFIASAVDLLFSGSAASYDQGMADTFRFQSAWLNATDFVIGGKSNADVLAITDTTTAIIDADFSLTGKIEQLRLEKGAANTSYTLTLGAKFDGSGIVALDATKAGVDVAVNAATTMLGHTFVAGAKNNTLTGGSADDVFQFDTATLNGSDFVTGGMSTAGDMLRFATGGAVSASALANIKGIELWQFSDKGNGIVLTDAVLATAQAVSQSYDGVGFIAKAFVTTGKGKDMVDLSQLNTAAGLAVVIGSAGGDKYIGSDLADNFVFQKASDLVSATQIDGGAGVDGLLLAAGTYTAAQFKGMTHIDRAYLGDVDPTAGYNLVLDKALFAGSDDHSFTIIGGIGMAGSVKIDASAVTDPLASLNVLGLVGDDVVKGTAGDDLFAFTNNGGTFQLDGKDIVVGGAGTDSITLNSSAGGVAVFSDGNMGGVTGIETLLVQVGGGTIFDCNPAALFQAEGVVEINGLASKGTLSIDAGLYTTDIVLHGGQGDDELESGSGDDAFVFTNAGAGLAATLTSADSVDGGAGEDALVFRGDATLNDLAFTNVKHIDAIELRQGAFSVTLGTNSDIAGIARVDASLADTTAVINGAPSKLQLTILGSDEADLIQGGSKADHLTGGKGGDILFGNGGNDVFVYESIADSRQRAGNDLTRSDVIEDFAVGDIIDIGAFTAGQVSVFNHGTVASFITADTANWFGSNDVAIAYDGALTRIYVDANQDGAFTLNQDLVIQLVGNHLAEGTNTATYV